MGKTVVLTDSPSPCHDGPDIAKEATVEFVIGFLFLAITFGINKLMTQPPRFSMAYQRKRQKRWGLR